MRPFSCQRGVAQTVVPYMYQHTVHIDHITGSLAVLTARRKMVATACVTVVFIYTGGAKDIRFSKSTVVI